MNLQLKQSKILGTSYSRLVTLPLWWLRSYNLEKGDVIEMTLDQDGNLILKPIKGDTNATA